MLLLINDNEFVTYISNVIFLLTHHQIAKWLCYFAMLMSSTVCVLYENPKTCWIIRNTTFMLHMLPDYSCNDDGLIAQDQRLFEIKHDIWILSLHVLCDWTPKENIKFNFLAKVLYSLKSIQFSICVSVFFCLSTCSNMSAWSLSTVWNK